MRKTKSLFALGAGLAGVSLASLGGGVTASQSPYGEALENFMGASPAFADCDFEYCRYLVEENHYVCDYAPMQNCQLTGGGQGCTGSPCV